MLNGWALLPGERHEGGCLSFAVAYCQGHPGSQLIIAVHDARSTHAKNALEAHAFICDHGAYADNLHPRPARVQGMSPIGFLNCNGMGFDTTWRVFRTIDFDNQTAEDRHVLEVLKKTAGA
jgi:hypothetical protein